MKCDNYSSCHNASVIAEDSSAIWVLCTECNAQERIGKDMKGNPEHRAVSEFMKRDFLQPGSMLYYKYAGAKGMNVV